VTLSPAVERRGRTSLGRPILRFEDRPLLTGTAEFFDDIVLPGMLHAAFLRSPLAHGLIAGLDLRAARAADDVAAVFAAADLGLPPLVTPCETPNAYSPPRPLLAEGVVRFVGEPIAVVVASSRYAAEDALDEIELDLDPLEAVVDPWYALEDGAPRLHPGRTNAYADSQTEAGDVDAAFVEAAVTVEAEIRHGRSAAVPIEPRGLVAEPDGDGLILWATTQGPHKLRLAVAASLGLPQERVRVVCTSVGGGFGQKAHVSPEEIVVASLARRLEKPVKWTEDRSENLLASSHARDQRLRVRVAAAADGRLLAFDVVQVVDQGAYGSYPHGTTLEALTTPPLLPGPYRLPAYRMHSRAAATNKCPQGAYRGVGFAVAAYVHERIVDLVAAELGLDRAEIRRRNLLSAGELPYLSVTNQRYDSGDFSAALERALDSIGYEGFEGERRRARLEGRLLGLGISCYVEPTGMNSAVFKGRGMVGIEGFDGAYVALDADSGATVWTTTPTVGQGTDTTFAQLVADGLSLEPESVRVAPVDTSVGGLEGTGTFASRSAVSAGGAVSRACAELERRLLEDAGGRFDVPVDDLELVGGAVRARATPDLTVAIGDLVSEAEAGRYEVGAQWDPPAVAYPYATHACVVEIDPETGRVEILRYSIADDCGRVINPPIVDGQVHGATAQGIAEALYEAVSYDGEGQLRNASLMDFLVPTAAELPSFALEHIEIPSPTTANGVKGVGEGGTLGAVGAVANAVCDALGTQLNEVPLLPERIVEAARVLLAGRS
jgi:carbon-monoxide dehydrogenase large subunit